MLELLPIADGDGPFIRHSRILIAGRQWRDAGHRRLVHPLGKDPAPADLSRRVAPREDRTPIEVPVPTGFPRLLTVAATHQNGKSSSSGALAIAAGFSLSDAALAPL